MKNSILFLLFLAVPFAGGNGQSAEQFRYDTMVARCDQGTTKKPTAFVSEDTVGPKGAKARAEIHCWKDKEKHFAMSDLFVNGKKVYSTPAAALRESCGSAAGEIYRPHNWSPDEKFFVFLLIPYCWETEGIPQVLMLHQREGEKTFAPNFKPIAEGIFKKYPKAMVFKNAVSFMAQPLGWKGNQLMLSVEIICYGCIDIKTKAVTPFPTTFWTITPEGQTTFLHEEREEEEKERRVTLEGRAKDAKGGAVIVTAEWGIVYIEGLFEWPSRLLDKQVVATGKLQEKKIIPSPTRGPQGEISAGAEGDQWVLKEAKWSLKR